MTFTLLSETDVEKILDGITPDNVSGFIEVLENALIEYSCGNEQQYQPHRGVVARPDGQVSLFMPATTSQSIGVKIVGVSPSQDPSLVQADKVPPPALRSALTLCDSLGRAVGILNAAELTAFRTALGSMLLYRFRQTTANVVVFGAGKQALWHIRLAILLRGRDISKITIVNRSIQRTQHLLDSLKSGPDWPSHVSLEAYSNEDKHALENLVSSADVIFCTTPSITPLFPRSFLISETARKRSRYISAIGSYRLDMAEIDPELLKTVTDPSGEFSSEVWKGHVAVDSREGCLQEAGELVTAKIKPEQMLEVGQIQDLRAKGSSPGLQEWLQSGFVIYKSVGTGVMDIAIGNYLLELARSRNIGFSIPNF